jgi:AraC-like DNA-binding protein
MHRTRPDPILYGLQDKRPFKEIPRQQRFAARPKLSQLFPARSRADRARRNDAIRRAHLEHGYSLSEIGQAVGLHYSTISRIGNPQDGDDAQNKTPY